MSHGHALSRPKQHLLRELAAWREETAQQRDLPRNWVAADRLLFQLAQSGPGTMAELAAVPGVDAKFAGRHGKALLARIADVRKQVGEESIWHTPRKLTAGERRFCDELARFIQECAERQQVAQSLIATRRDLEQLVRGDSEVALLQGWRRELVGAEVAQRVAEWRRSAGAGNAAAS